VSASRSPRCRHHLPPLPFFASLPWGLAHEADAVKRQIFDLIIVFQFTALPARFLRVSPMVVRRQRASSPAVRPLPLSSPFRPLLLLACCVAVSAFTIDETPGVSPTALLPTAVISPTRVITIARTFARAVWRVSGRVCAVCWRRAVSRVPLPLSALASVVCDDCFNVLLADLFTNFSPGILCHLQFPFVSS
jgi:hypothetical protein